MTDLAAVLSPGRPILFEAYDLNSIPSNFIIPSYQIVLIRSTGNLYIGNGSTSFGLLSPLSATIGGITQAVAETNYKLYNSVTSYGAVGDVVELSTLSTSAASAQTLVNDIRSKLIALGLMQ